MVASLEHLGVSAKLSDAGQVAKQMLQQLEGLNGLALLAYPDTLKLLNEMAVGMRIRRHGEAVVEEVFDSKTRTERHWRAHIAERRSRGALARARPLPFHRPERHSPGPGHEVSEMHARELAQA